MWKLFILILKLNNFLLCSSQLCADGKQLLDILQTPVTSGSNNSITAKADYSEGAAHVLDVVHEVFAHHRAIEQIWHRGKVKLHQRLGLRLFQQDVKQVRYCTLVTYVNMCWQMAKLFISNKLLALKDLMMCATIHDTNKWSCIWTLD